MQSKKKLVTLIMHDKSPAVDGLQSKDLGESVVAFASRVVVFLLVF